MQLPAVDRSPYQRPVGAEGVSVAAHKVIPVAPVNPAVSVASVAHAKPAPTPDVVNLVNQAHKPNAGEGVYFSVSDPANRGSEAATVEKDWTIHRPEPVKVETPPPEPISKMLLAFLRDMWRASGSAIEAQMVSTKPKTRPPTQPTRREPSPKKC